MQERDDNDKFVFDAALSFHSLDEAIATQLSDLLQDRFRIFLYSKQQELLAGRDGEEKFNSVFGKDSRIVIVFYRSEWGSTPFTRIEQTAIRNRAYAEGYDFSLFIPMDKTVPSWLPRTQLWFGLDRFGLKGAAAVIEARIQEKGGEPKTESIGDRAARLQRALQLTEAQEAFFRSETGVKEAEAALARLVSAIETSVTSIKSSHSKFAQLRVKRLQEYWLVGGLGPFLVISWWRHFVNSLDESKLEATFYDGVPRLPGLVPVHDKPRVIERLIFDYRLFAAERHGYVNRSDPEQQLSAEELADYLLRKYMDVAERFRQH